MTVMEQDEMNQPQKITPLYETHRKAGGKMVDFHGWMLPIQYGGILQEHEAVRNRAGLFDVSHMGELEVSGPDAFDFLQRMLTNNIAAKSGKAVYSPMCYPSGGTVDDLIVYKKHDNEYLLVVNAANTEKDFDWLKNNETGRVMIANRSDEYAQIALQGPKAAGILQNLLKEKLNEMRFYQYIESTLAGNLKVMLSRTGYTGEDGFEIYCRPDDAEKIWNLLMETGEPYGLVPAGLGARDTLRLEAALPLYGQELSETITPVMAGLQRFIKLDKGEFNGREPLAEQLAGRLKRRLAGFELLDRAIPRSGYEIWCGGRQAGYVTSGGFFPALKKSMGIALVDVDCAGEGSTVEVKIRDGLHTARIVKLPFLRKGGLPGTGA